MAVGGCPFPGVHLENLNPSPSIIPRAQSQSHARTDDTTNPSYFLKVKGNNGDDRVGTLTSESQTQASHSKATLPLS